MWKRELQKSRQRQNTKAACGNWSQRKSLGSFKFQNGPWYNPCLPWGFGLTPDTEDCKHFSSHINGRILCLLLRHFLLKRPVAKQVKNTGRNLRARPRSFQLTHRFSLLALPVPIKDEFSTPDLTTRVWKPGMRSQLAKWDLLANDLWASSRSWVCYSEESGRFMEGGGEVSVKCEMGKPGGVVPKPSQGGGCSPVSLMGEWGWGRGDTLLLERKSTCDSSLPDPAGWAARVWSQDWRVSGSWLHQVPISSGSDTVGSHHDMVTIKPSATGPYPGVRLFSSLAMWLQVAPISLWLDFLQIPITSCLIFWDRLLDHTNCNNCLQRTDPLPDPQCAQEKYSICISEMWELLPM